MTSEGRVARTHLPRSAVDRAELSAFRGALAPRVVHVSQRPKDASAAWQELDRADYDRYWARFDRAFGFRPGVGPDSWPAISEPVPSVTYDLSVVRDGPERGAAYDAINAEALRAFVWSMPEISELVVLDW